MKSLIPFLLFLFLFSCHENNSGNFSPQLNHDSILKDSITKIEKTKIHSIDSEIVIEKNKQNFLKTKFDLVADACTNKTYCHKNFWGSYFIRDQCLVCGLDSIGQAFLVADSYEGLVDDKKQKQYDQSEITVEIGDSVFHTQSGKIVYHSICDSAATLMYICACTPEQRSFYNGSDNGILKQIASHPDEKIIFYFTYKENRISPRYTLGKRYKTGITESIELSETFEKISKLEKEKSGLVKKQNSAV